MVLCASKKLNQAQRNYATNKRELYGIIFCLQKFLHYLLGRKFVIRVDHAPLLSMIKDSNNVTFLNWKECLLEFDFELEFIPGKMNIVADALSRTSFPNDISDQDNLQFMALEDGSSSSSSSDDVNTSKLDEKQQLLIAVEKVGKKLIKEENLDSMIDNYHHFGHYAVEGTFKRIWNDGFWHPDLRSRINSRISKCIECLKNNIVSNGYHPSWSIEANSIFDHIQVDLQGPFTKDLNNNCYLLTAIDVLSGFVIYQTKLKNQFHML
jgi:hypothetical protein